MIGEPALSDTRRVLVILTKKGALKGCKSGASQLKSSVGELKVNSSLALVKNTIIAKNQVCLTLL